nr:5011_t:CDS:2 [Entrophospora candida]
MFNKYFSTINSTISKHPISISKFQKTITITSRYLYNSNKLLDDFNNNNSNETLPPSSSSPDNEKITISTESEKDQQQTKSEPEALESLLFPSASSPSPASPVSFSSILKERSKLSNNMITIKSNPPPSSMLRQWDKVPGNLTNSNTRRVLNPGMMATSRFIRIDGLANTVITNDILFLSKEVNGDQKSIDDVLMLRDRVFNLTGSAIVQFRNTTFAKNFYMYAPTKFLSSGGQLKMNFILKAQDFGYEEMLNEWKTYKKSTVMNFGPSQGKSVIITGTPRDVGSRIISKFLSDFPSLRNQEYIFPLPNSKYSITSKFLVKLNDTNDAYRIARLFNNTYFFPGHYGEKYKIKISVAY